MNLQGRGDRCGNMGMWGYGHMRYRSGGYEIPKGGIHMMMLGLKVVGWREKEEGGGAGEDAVATHPSQQIAGEKHREKKRYISCYSTAKKRKKKVLSRTARCM